MNLYEINEHYRQVIENGFSFDEETGEILFDETNLDELDGAFKEKVDNIACFIKDLEAMEAAMANEIKALQERKKACETKADKLKDYIRLAMETREMDRMETSRNKITFRKSVSVNVKDESRIADIYFKEKVERKLDKKTLLADLKKGVEVEGCELQEKRNLQLK